MCYLSSGKSLVVMDNLTKGEVKVVCYSGSTEKQLFHFDPEGQSLFLIPYYHCSIDFTSNIVVISVTVVHKQSIIVVDSAGELRFQHTGIPQPT